MDRSVLTWFLVVLAGLVAASAVWYYFLSGMAAPAPIAESGYSVDRTPTTLLTLHSQNYALAKSYQKSKQYDLALEFFQKALPEAQDRSQTAQIRYNIAVMNEDLGNYKEAIAQFKEIAADTANSPIIRAYSVQEIGLMHYAYYKPADRQLIITETFKDPPYSELRKDKSLNFAYTELFGYAAAIYPIANSEARLAYGYSNELQDSLRGATTSPQGKDYVALITRSVQAADADLERVKKIPSESGFIPDILARQGTTVGHLVALGAGDPRQAESYFQKSIQYAAVVGDKPGNYSAFLYAAFLAYQYKDARAADIKSILEPFRIGNEEAIIPGIADFFRTSRTDPTLTNEKLRLVLMGRADPDFKKYLISLGWKASDF